MSNFKKKGNFSEKKALTLDYSQKEECSQCKKLKFKIDELEEKSINQEKIFKKLKNFHEESEKTFKMLESDNNILKIQIDNLASQNVEISQQLIIIKKKNNELEKIIVSKNENNSENFEGKIIDDRNSFSKRFGDFKSARRSEDFFENKMKHSLNEQKKTLDEAYNKKLNESQYNYELKIKKVEKILDEKLGKSMKKNIIFIEKVSKMVKECHPENFFKREDPTLKYIWKWVKVVIENYFQMKKNSEIFENVIQKVKILVNCPLNTSNQSLQNILNNLIEKNRR